MSILTLMNTAELPKEYKEFQEICVDPNIMLLPEDRPYVCEIPLIKEDVELPNKGIYNFSPKELVALESVFSKTI